MVVLDEAHRSCVPQAPGGRTVRRSHEELSHCGRHGLEHTDDTTALENFLADFACEPAAL